MPQSAPPPKLDPLNALAVTVRAASRRGAKLSKERKQFNKLVKDIDALRAALTQWREFVPTLHNRVTTKIEPLVARFRERRVQLVMVLSHAIDGRELSKRQKTKAIEILHWHLSEILAAGPDKDLIALYDKYADIGFEEQQAAEADFLRTMANEVFGLDIDEVEDASTLTAEDFEQLMTAKIEAEQQSETARRAATPKQSAKAQAQEALRHQLAQGASQAVREIYRKLASELHPDREPDEDERARKTALMQQANQAYASSDLLTLLGLQLQTEQLDSTALNSLARERLLQYNHLLADQCRQLRTELEDLIAPFAMNRVGGTGELTPDTVVRALDREARELKRWAKDCEADIAHFQDMRNIKHALNAYQLGDLDADYASPLDEIFFEIPSPPPRRRR